MTSVSCLYQLRESRPYGRLETVAAVAVSVFERTVLLFPWSSIIMVVVVVATGGTKTVHDTPRLQSWTVEEVNRQ